MLSRWNYSVQLILTSIENNRLYSIFKELTEEHLLPPTLIDQDLSTLVLNTNVKNLVVQISTLSVDKRDELLKRFSSIDHIDSIYLLGKSIENKEERLKFFREYPKVCIFCENEEKLVLRWSLDTIEEYRTLGDQYIEQKNKDLARDFYQRGIVLFDEMKKRFQK